MLLTPLEARKLISFCIDERCAMLAVNVDNPSVIHDCFKAAKEMDAPIIIETSRWQLEGISFGAGDPIRGIAVCIAQINIFADSKEFREIPVLYHTDHINGPDALNILSTAVKGIPFTIDGKTVHLTPSSICVDASRLSMEENTMRTNALIETSKKHDQPLTLEMEAGIDTGYTAPEVVKKLVTEVEQKHPGYLYLFAPGLGNRHGYSLEGYPDFRPENIEKSAALLKNLTGRNIGIALHGSSGLSETQLREAVRHGLTKVNWSTNNIILRSSAAREYYSVYGEKMDPKYPGFKKMATDNGVGQYVSSKFIPAVRNLITVLNSAGKAGKFVKTLL